MTMGKKLLSKDTEEQKNNADHVEVKKRSHSFTQQESVNPHKSL